VSIIYSTQGQAPWVRFTTPQGILWFIETKRDDCDAHAQVRASLAAWCGYPRMLIAVGWYGKNRPEGKTLNHAYNLFPTPDGSDFYLDDTVGDRTINGYRLLSEVKNYWTVCAADIMGRYYVFKRDHRNVLLLPAGLHDTAAGDRS